MYGKYWRTLFGNVSLCGLCMDYGWILGDSLLPHLNPYFSLGIRYAISCPLSNWLRSSKSLKSLSSFSFLPFFCQISAIMIQYTLNILLYSFYQFTSSHSFFHPSKLSVAPHVVRVSHQPYSLVLQQRLRQMKLPSNRRSRENRDMLRNLWIGILYTYYIYLIHCDIRCIMQGVWKVGETQ